MASIKDVAKRANVSIGTVSNVINKTRYVSPELTEKITQAIKELGYTVNYFARSLKCKYTKTIGIIATDITRVFYSHVITGMQKAASEFGYMLLIFSTYNDFESEKKAIEKCKNAMVDAIVLDTSANLTNTDYFSYLSTLYTSNRHIPILSIEVNLSSFGISSIFVDGIKSSICAVKHLIEKGCSKNIHIAGPSTSTLSKERMLGYKKALLSSGLPLDENYIIEGNFGYKSGYTIVNNFIEKGLFFNGIFACNDQMAIGACKALLQHGINIPEEVKVIGYDNSYNSSIVTPTLSTINVPKEKMGYQSIIDIVNIIENEDEHYFSSNCLETELIVRETTDTNVSINHFSFED